MAYYKKSRHSLTYLFAFLLTLLIAPGAQAADDGQTHPKLTSGAMSWGGGGYSTDIIGLTSGSGNIKGFFCSSINGALSSSTIQIYVNGGSAQILNLVDAPAIQDNDGMTYYTGWVPLNVRFSTSIKVQLTRSNTNSQVGCSVSWALD